jgi:AbrB family looped-hinge helix DNA binding protein
MNITIDAAGRVVVPKAIRDQAGLRPNVPLEIRVRDGRIEIEPAPRQVTRIKKGRISVATAAKTEKLSAETVREIQRSLRDRQP